MRTKYINELPDQMKPAAAVFAALGEPTRQKILLLFEPGEELSIKDITGCFKLSRTTVVHHLSCLEEAGLLEMRREGRLTLFRVKYDAALVALSQLQEYIYDDLKIWNEKKGR